MREKNPYFKNWLYNIYCRCTKKLHIKYLMDVMCIKLQHFIYVLRSIEAKDMSAFYYKIDTREIHSLRFIKVHYTLQGKIKYVFIAYTKKLFYLEINSNTYVGNENL